MKKWVVICTANSDRSLAGQNLMRECLACEIVRQLPYSPACTQFVVHDSASDLSLNFSTFLLDPVIHPSSYTAYYGEPNVTFNCFAFNASNIIWVVNNVSTQYLEVEAQGISTTINHTVPESNLTITSTIGNNNTHLECLAYYGTFSFRVSETVFYVQGKLSNLTDILVYS